jgi:hypothetical protein
LDRSLIRVADLSKSAAGRSMSSNYGSDHFAQRESGRPNALLVSERIATPIAALRANCDHACALQLPRQPWFGTEPVA